jgi:hypothetical protein
MNRLTLIIFLLFIYLKCDSQTISAIKEYGNGVSVCAAYDVEVDNCGNIYSCGILQGGGIYQIDSFSVPTSAYTGVLISHAPNGDAVWVRTLTSSSGSNRCRYYDITTDTFCNVYVCGSVTDGDIILEDDTIPTHGGLLIVKYDQFGNRLWYRLFDSANAEQRFGIDYSISGYLYAGMWFYDSLKVDSHYYQAQFNSNIVIVKMRDDGSTVWSEMFGNGGESSCYSISANDSGSFYFTGKFSQSLNFGHNNFADASIVPGQIGAYLTACDSQGNSFNSRLFGYKSDFYRVNNYNNIMLSSGTDGEYVKHGKYVPGVQGLEFSGHTDPGNNLPKGYGSCMDPFGNMYVTGKFDETFGLSDIVAGDYITSSGNHYDAYLGIYNSSNIITGLVRVPNHGYSDAGHAVAFAPPGKVFIAGEQGLLSTGKNYMLAIYDVSQILQSPENSFPFYSGPNPVYNYFTIGNISSNDITGIEIYSIGGKQYKANLIESASDKIIIDLRDYPNGAYIVRLLTPVKKINLKVIKM